MINIEIFFNKIIIKDMEREGRERERENENKNGVLFFMEKVVIHKFEEQNSLFSTTSSKRSNSVSVF